MKKQHYKLTAAIIISIILLIVMCNNALAANYDYTVENGRRVPIPRTYTVKNVFGFFNDGEITINQGNDLFIDRQGILYIVDTGNHRVIKTTRDGEVLGVYTGPDGKPLKDPMGIFVDKYGDMYIADKGNARILHLSPSGEYIEEFVKPESPLLGTEFIFEPNNVYVGPTGYIYTTKGHSIMVIDANNDFRGYIGSIEIGFDLKRALIRMFATDEQKSRIARDMPPSYSSLVIHDDGMIYTTSINTTSQQIRKINSVGKNVFKSDSFGERFDDEGNMIIPHFVDLAVDKNGIVSALEQRSGRIYQYDQDGNVLTVFGGMGDKKGQFRFPTAIEVDDDGNIYVLDRTQNNIQVFEPTSFIKLVHEAAKCQYDGGYSEAQELWMEALKIDSNYSLAHKGIGTVLLKEKRWKEAMEEFKAANDIAGYSSAFDNYRHQVFRSYFGFVFIGVVIAAYVMYKLIIQAKKVADEVIERVDKYIR